MASFLGSEKAEGKKMCGKLSVTNFSVELVLARNVRFNFWTGVAGCHRVGFQSALNRKTVGDNRSTLERKTTRPTRD